ncbi:hypothetical protein ScPMuIL_004460 [Solemya velum]
MLDINLLGYCICTREAIRSMRDRGAKGGHVFFMNSLAGLRFPGNTNLHLYSVTKYAVTAYAEGVRRELREMKSPIRVTSISPGIVETDFAMTMLQNEAKAAETYAHFKCLQPEDIANAVEYALNSPDHVQVDNILIRPTQQTS